MIFQLMASTVLVGVFLYACLQFRSAPRVAITALAVTVLGEFLVLAPEQANGIAHLFGIGRGADLISYSWILLSLIVVLNLHLKIRASSERYADLVRALALRDAESVLEANGDAPPKG